MKPKTKTRYAVVGVYGGDDGYAALVYCYGTYGTMAGAKRRCLGIANTILERHDKDMPFDEAWEEVNDCGDIGYDPIDNIVGYERLRIMKMGVPA